MLWRLALAQFAMCNVPSYPRGSSFLVWRKGRCLLLVIEAATAESETNNLAFFSALGAAESHRPLIQVSRLCLLIL